MIADPEDYARLWQGIWAVSPMLAIGVLMFLVAAWPRRRGK